MIPPTDTRRSSNQMNCRVYCSVSIVVSIPACHVGDLGSIPRRSDRRGHLENTRRSACDIRPTLFVSSISYQALPSRLACVVGAKTQQTTRDPEQNKNKNKTNKKKEPKPRIQILKTPQRARRDALFIRKAAPRRKKAGTLPNRSAQAKKK